jgi:transaldolase/glucose-6-phosphate isomerase
MDAKGHKSKSKRLVSPLKKLMQSGQSLWLDYIRRSLITSGELKRMVEEDDLRGITSNPSIFEKAIAGSSDYEDVFKELSDEITLNKKTVYERIAVEDIQLAAKVMEPVYQESQGRDGYVCLEVSPHLSHDTQGTCEEARRLWKMVDRPNVMIKVPATHEGIPAIEQLISEGININVTLIFSREVYEYVAQAYINGLEKLAKSGGDISGVASVASFFVSRIDSAIDPIIKEKVAVARDEKERARLESLYGKVSIANAKLAYLLYKELITQERWQALKRKGAQTQRLLWASTGTKNPQYSDVLYIERLIGVDTVNTVPPATYDAFRDHGLVESTLEKEMTEAMETMEMLPQLGINFKEVADDLLTKGLKLFEDAFDNLLCAIEKARTSSDALFKRQSCILPKKLSEKVNEVLEDWRSNKKAYRLWQKDASLWTGHDENNWLGWLGISGEQLEDLSDFVSIVEKIKSGKFSHILLLGMGGSSLCPEVLKATFGQIDGYPAMHVIDSTDPAQIKAIEEKVDLAKTLFIVSSKSGSTLEPNIFKQYFFERVKEKVGAENAGKQFVAITDPGSHLQKVAEKENFSRIYFGISSIGGRFSALSKFGMVPAAAMGIDVAKLLSQTELMVHACAACVPTEENPGLVLGAILGILGKHGINKVTLAASPRISSIGAWLEQLLAESTGKDGKGLIPVDTEELGSPAAYGQDRFFVYMRYKPQPDYKQDVAIDQLEKAGHPVMRINIHDIYDLGQQFFLWEIATAVAASVLEINPFNQPDVEASKIATKELTHEYETNGQIPHEEHLFEADGIKLFADERNTSQLTNAVGEKRNLEAYLKAHFDQIKDSDYVALLAYIEMNKEHKELLQNIRHLIRDQKKVATCLGFGPRFLHSTGQAYKGGPDSGVFLQITCDDAVDLPVPGQKYTFGIVKAAQAQGDFQVLSDRKRRALRIHVSKNVGADLQKLIKIIERF